MGLYQINVITTNRLQDQTNCTNFHLVCIIITDVHVHAEHRHQFVTAGEHLLRFLQSDGHYGGAMCDYIG